MPGTRLLVATDIMDSPLLENSQKQTYVETDLIEERYEDTKKIEHDITEINNLYNDVSILVEEQGSGLDCVESIIDESNHTINKGVVELDKAKKYQKKTRKKACCIMTTILIILAIILIPLFSH